MTLDSQIFFDKIDFKLRTLLNDILGVVQEINLELRIRSDSFKEHESENRFGEKQLKIDLLTNEMIKQQLSRNGLVNTILSEEEDEIVEVGDRSCPYFVAYDPLDGSSLVKNNLPLGSIFAIWEGSSLIHKKGKDLLGAFYVIYGIKVTVVMAVRQLGVVQFVLENDNKTSFEVKGNLSIDSKNFSFGNMRACHGNRNLFRLLEHYVNEEKTLRYVGCLVVDCHKIISDQQGIFIYVNSKKQEPKLRLIFECLPLAFIIEELQGSAVDDQGKPILDIDIMDYYQRTSIILGSRNEVKRALQYLENEMG